MAGFDIKLKPMIDECYVLTKDRGVVRFGDVMNHSQIALIAETERQIRETGRVRIIILKARQMGLSTAVESIIFVLSILFNDFQSLILSHDKGSSEHLLTMTQRFWNTYPFKEFHTTKYAGRKQLAWSDTESNIQIETANNDTAGSSKTLHALHASEVSKWKGNPRELLASLQPAIPFFGLTCIFYESTAKGIGNHFHTLVQEARMVPKKTENILMFFPWWQHPEYTADYITEDAKNEYATLGELDEEEKKLVGMGITESRLAWRRWTIINSFNNDLDMFKQEYPATIDEAFLSTGRNVFGLDNLTRHYRPMSPHVGRLEYLGNKVIFIRDDRGPLNIYRYPHPDVNAGVYQIGADPTHSLVGDKACAQVMNRRTLEQCATWRGNVDPREFGRVCSLLGEFYNFATVAPEKQGPGYATIGFLTGINYPRVWQSQKVDKMQGIHVGEDIYGWSSNASTKTTAIQNLVNAIGQPLTVMKHPGGEQTYGLVIHDRATFEEMSNYVISDEGKYMNGAGSLFDDTVMAMGICYTTHLWDPQVVPYAPDLAARERVVEVAEKMPGAVRMGPTVSSAENGKTGILLSQADYDNFGNDDLGE